jgi:hypothetical protein
MMAPILISRTSRRSRRPLHHQAGGAKAARSVMGGGAHAAAIAEVDAIDFDIPQIPKVVEHEPENAEKPPILFQKRSPFLMRAPNLPQRPKVTSALERPLKHRLASIWKSREGRNRARGVHFTRKYRVTET